MHVTLASFSSICRQKMGDRCNHGNSCLHTSSFPALISGRGRRRESGGNGSGSNGWRENRKIGREEGVSPDACLVGANASRKWPSSALSLSLWHYSRRSGLVSSTVLYYTPTHGGIKRSKRECTIKGPCQKKGLVTYRGHCRHHPKKTELLFLLLLYVRTLA